MTTLDLSRIPDVSDPASVAALRAAGILRGQPQPHVRRVRPDHGTLTRRRHPPEHREALERAAREYIAVFQHDGRSWGLGAIVAAKHGVAVQHLHTTVQNIRRRKT